jgi:Ca2+-binding EF-hand superfamily protein
MIAQLDTNKDGKISSAEYAAPPLANFDRFDTNRDGTLSAQEAEALRR